MAAAATAATPQHNGDPLATFAALFTQSAIDQAIQAIPYLREPGNAVRCLDIAAGTGAATWQMLNTLCRQNINRHVSITAIDLNSAMLEQINQQIPNALLPYPNAKITTQVCDMQTLEGIPSGFSADLCTMTFGIMFPSDTVAALRQVKRVLAPTGVAVVTSWTWHSTMEDTNAFLYEQGKIQDLSDYALPFQEGTDREYALRIAARKAGFEKISVAYIQHSDFPMSVGTLAKSCMSNSLLAQYQPLDEGAMERFLRSYEDGEDAELGPLRKVSATALCLRLGF